MTKKLMAAAFACAALAGPIAHADTGKLVLTGGVSSIDGAAGGGLTPWAVIGSNATAGEIGVAAHLSRARTQDYGLATYGIALGYHDRVELSLAQQDFNAGPALALNGIAPFGVRPGQHIKMDIAGLKVRVAGDAVLESDTLMPQVAIGVEHKRTHPGSIASVFDFLGARSSGTDVYVNATKLFLAQGILVNATLRNTNANQNGLLGFGSTGNKRYVFKPEVSVAYLLRKNLAIGAEYRAKPDKLAFAGSAFDENAWRDVFIAWAPSKNVSITAAYVALGNIVGHEHQTGGYVSVQLAY